MKSLKERVAIMQAYLDGKPVERLNGIDKWMPVTADVEYEFNWQEYDYRIKPATPVVLYQALCKAGRGYYVSSYLYIDEAAARKELPNDFIRLLTEHPITVEVPE